jgi:hypothetical protein
MRAFIVPIPLRVSKIRVGLMVVVLPSEPVVVLK